MPDGISGGDGPGTPAGSRRWAHRPWESETAVARVPNQHLSPLERLLQSLLHLRVVGNSPRPGEPEFAATIERQGQHAVEQWVDAGGNTNAARRIKVDPAVALFAEADGLFTSTTPLAQKATLDLHPTMRDELFESLSTSEMTAPKEDDGIARQRRNDGQWYPLAQPARRTMRSGVGHEDRDQPGHR